MDRDTIVNKVNMWCAEWQRLYNDCAGCPGESICSIDYLPIKEMTTESLKKILVLCDEYLQDKYLLDEYISSDKTKNIKCIKSFMTDKEYYRFLTGNVIKHLLDRKDKNQSLKRLNEARNYLDLLIKNIEEDK